MASALQLGFYYAAIFIGSGARLPFMPVWFRAEGLSGTQLALILSAPLFIQTFTGPALALWADTFRLRRTPMIWMAVVAAGAFAAMVLLRGFWWWLACWCLASLLMATFSPLTDVIVLRRARLDGFAYGMPRGIGSAAYIVANVAMGLVLARWGPATVLVWAVAASLITAACARALLPPDAVVAFGERGRMGELAKGLGHLIRRRDFMLLIVSASLIQGSHGFFYSFSTLIWRHQGLEAWSGPLWGFSVAVELVFMWFMEPWRRRVGPERLLVIGGTGAVVRWIALALSPPLWLTFPIQGLHALSFTATFLATLRLIERMAPPEDASAAQTLNASVSSGLVTGLATLAAGPLFDVFGARGYWAMAVVAAVGVCGAVMLLLGGPRFRQAKAAPGALSG
jgi:MFS transporter, PPP family, 3-phenylpropionic acid transporter